MADKEGQPDEKQVKLLLEKIADELDGLSKKFRESNVDHISVFLLLFEMQRLEEIMVKLNKLFLINSGV